MKKLLFTCALIFTFLSSFSQDKPEEYGFSKGDKIVTGDIGFNNSSQRDNKQNTFGTNIKMGVFVTKNIVVGAGLSFGTSTNKGINTNTIKSQSYQAVAFGRYYFTPTKQFSFFNELALGLSSSRTKYSQQSLVPTTEKSNGFGAIFSAGINYFVTKNLSLQGSIGALNYNTASNDNPMSDTRKNFNVNLDFSNVSLGLNYRF